MVTSFFKNISVRPAHSYFPFDQILLRKFVNQKRVDQKRLAIEAKEFFLEVFILNNYSWFNGTLFDFNTFMKLYDQENKKTLCEFEYVSVADSPMNWMVPEVFENGDMPHPIITAPALVVDFL